MFLLFISLQITGQCAFIDDGMLLNKNYMPNTIHCVDFNHYLSMKSVMREVQPDLIIFHHEVLPVIDKWIYNTWFDKLRKEFPFIYVMTTGQAEKICFQSQKPNPNFIYTQLTKHGGIYVHEQTMFLQFPNGMRKYETGYGFLLLKKGFHGNRSSANKIRNSKYITDPTGL